MSYLHPIINIENLEKEVNNIFECEKLNISIKSKIDAERVLCDHLVRAFNLIENPVTKTLTKEE